MLSASPSRSRAGFSLVEVALAIGIVAFAFVALLGLIPTGLNTFRQAIDKTNETAIVQDLNSMVQVTPWDKIDALDYKTSQEIFYYNDEGRFVDSSVHSSAAGGALLQRLYGAKLIIEPLRRPDTAATHEEMAGARRVIVVIANVTQPPAKAALDTAVNADTVSKLPTGVSITVHPFVVTQMDASAKSS